MSISEDFLLDWEPSSSSWSSESELEFDWLCDELSDSEDYIVTSSDSDEIMLVFVSESFVSCLEDGIVILGLFFDPFVDFIFYEPP